jgi:hypothetical protein
MTDPGPPGVYIVELPATGPIAGVGTSTAAFIGAAQKGPLLTPTLTVNWTQFKAAFGEHLADPRAHLAPAVRGFFENGGTSAYVVRVGTATRAELPLEDRSPAGHPCLVVRALEEGPGGAETTVEVRDAQIVPAEQDCTVVRAQATATAVAGDRVTLEDPEAAGRFRPGDLVQIEGVDGRSEVTGVEGDTLVLAAALPAGTAPGPVRIADLAAGQQTVRLRNAGGIERGSVVRLAQGNRNEAAVVASVSDDRVELAQGLTRGFPLAENSDAVRVTTLEFGLTVRRGAVVEDLSPLSMDRRHSRSVLAAARSEIVEVALPDPPTTTPPPDDRPKVAAARPLQGGTADDLGQLGPSHVEAALAELRKVDDVSIVCVPGNTDPDVQQKVIGHCEQMQDRFAVLDATRGAPPSGTGSVLDQRGKLDSARGYAALYYPWLLVPDPAGGPEPLLVPPSGHVAGIYARSDTERGVHKAPANELVRGARGLERVLEDGEQTELNKKGVNALRVFAGRARPVVWGARTTAPPEATTWRYVNVRRLMLFIEESIQEGIRWAVFEPNDLSLRKALVRTVSEFLERVWSSGALFGATPAEAFYVVCDDELNPPDVRELGQLVMEVGVAPVRPAEFVIVRIGVWPGAGSDEG